MPRSGARTAAMLLAFLIGFTGALHSQVGASTDILTGVVTDENGAPLAGAIVEALSLETQITRRTNTDARGRCTILFPDGGGQYQLTARYLGRQPQQTTLQRYAVNERFGATGRGANAFRAPFQIGIQAHLTIGPDRQQAALDALRGFGGPRGAGRGFGGAGGFGMAARMDSVLANPPAQVLALRDSIALTPGQITALEAARDSLGSELRVIGDSMRSAAAAFAGSTDRQAVAAWVRAQFALARDAVTRAVDAIHGALTAEQWNRLPESIRNPRVAPRAGGVPPNNRN